MFLIKFSFQYLLAGWGLAGWGAACPVLARFGFLHTRLHLPDFTSRCVSPLMLGIDPITGRFLYYSIVLLDLITHCETLCYLFTRRSVIWKSSLAVFTYRRKWNHKGNQFPSGSSSLLRRASGAPSSFLLVPLFGCHGNPQAWQLIFQDVMEQNVDRLFFIELRGERGGNREGREGGGGRLEMCPFIYRYSLER